ncbi:TRAP transporter small permease [Pseudooceanicola sp. LIPI14-2-Ac024]|uniref:TRAP transporter small permease n=1 Tax=Pseudooceanicola sp. LIPI14-2-Ac024 TaxID=3344875 RepID=UPI0035CFEFA0
MGRNDPLLRRFRGLHAGRIVVLRAGLHAADGGHIRVSLITQRMSGPLALAAEVFCLLLAIAVTGVAGWFLVALVQESLHYGDTSSGIVPIPLWIPQTAVTVGMGLLIVALVDTLVETLRAGHPVLPESVEE